jgi:hypothetical protein
VKKTIRIESGHIGYQGGICEKKDPGNISNGKDGK